MEQVELVNVKEAARLTGLTKFFLYRYAAAGKIPHFRAGKALRFSMTELLDWMRSGGTEAIKGNGDG